MKCRRFPWRRPSRRSGQLPFLVKFSSKEIKRATNGFNMVLQSHSDETIYKAQFSDDHVAAVKKVRPQQGIDAFYTQVQLLGCLHHRHLVSLQGFTEGHDRFLIFDHMENGTLRECLHDPLKTPLNWRTRLQIAIDVAAALEYLYYFCDPPVYNVSVNSGNVLLDENYTAKLFEVELVDYERKHTGPSNATCSKDDIDKRTRDALFQFGALILELITGQSLGGENELVQWVQESGFACSMHNMVDGDLGDSYDPKELKSLLIIARLCTRTGDTRTGDAPPISFPQILRYLQGKMERSLEV